MTGVQTCALPISTTVKTALIDEEGALLASWYGRNQGDPLSGLVPCLIEMLDALPPGLVLHASAATGYGAQLAEAALGLDFVDVETVAHLKAACALVPDCSYVIDIGGQDMKCLKADNGVIAGVTLNEACSAGCGAFLETFARSLGPCIVFYQFVCDIFIFVQSSILFFFSISLDVELYCRDYVLF